MTNDHGGYYPPPGGQPWGSSQGPPPGYPNYPGPLQQPPSTGKNRWPWLLGIGAAVVVLVLVVAVGLVVITSGGDGDEQALPRTEVTYEVTGTVESVELVYYSDEGQKHLSAVALPWSQTVTLEGEDAYFDVSAQTVDASDQELGCRVSTNGKTLVQDRTISGFVGCGGRLNEF